MKAIVIFTLVALAIAASAKPTTLVDNPGALEIDSQMQVEDETADRGKRNLGFGVGAGQSLSFGVNTPLGGFGVAESTAFNKQKQIGLLGLGAKKGFGVANSKNFKVGVNGPLGGFGIGGSTFGAAGGFLGKK